MENSGDAVHDSDKKCIDEHTAVASNGLVDTNVEEFRFSQNLSLENIRHLQSEFARERNWQQYHTPRNLLLAMVGEVGEVSELFQWKGEVAVGLPDWSEADRTDLAHELSDVLIYLVRLSQQCHIDLPTAVLEKLALNRCKYPAERVYGSSKKYNQYTELNNSEINAQSIAASTTCNAACNGCNGTSSEIGHGCEVAKTSFEKELKQ